MRTHYVFFSPSTRPPPLPLRKFLPCSFVSESDRDGVRVVVELKRDANPQVNLLFGYFGRLPCYVRFDFVQSPS